MDIIPVIDIFNGNVVTAIQGKRDSYHPVDLKLYNTIDPIEIINIYGLDPLRYYLIKEVSFCNDGNISKDKLENCINSV